MKSYKPLIIYSSLLLALHTTILKAEQVKIYDHPPSAEEMGRVLFGQGSEESQEPEESPNIKMRSISFGKKESPKPKEPVRHNKSEGNRETSTKLTSIGLPIQFAYNSDQILEESTPFLEEVGKMLTLEEYANKRLVVEGHTDSAGSDSYNKALSQRRANAVKHYLSTNFSISASRLQARGLGESKPLPGYSPDDEANRRVQFYSAN
jgi:OmpA-OmpF porin, OOP family